MNICRSVVKKDHSEKMQGKALYVADYPARDMLTGRLVRSTKARAEIVAMHLPPLPEGYFSVSHKDIPGVNEVHIVLDDCPVYAEKTVEYMGEPILMICGPDEATVLRLASEVRIDYGELPPVLDPKQSKTVFFDYHYDKGDCDAAFAEADTVVTEEFRTGYQEQAYIETQGLVARFEKGRLILHGSMQCPYYVHGAIAKALGLAPDKVQVRQDTTGGGFGGKEAYPSILACQVAVAAYRAGGKDVRVIYDRREDMEFTSKRHPSICNYRLAMKNNTVTAMDIDVLFDGGAFTTLSAVVLQRGIICSSGVYNVPNLKVRGRAVKTNTVPCGAYRGFGAPQTFFAVEGIMRHLAQSLGEEPLAFKKRHLARQGDSTSTSGKYHFPVPLPEMLEKLEAASGYNKKRQEYRNQTGRYRKGIGSALWFHGAGFTGSGERDFIKAVTRLHKYADGTVEVLASNTDIGQGLKTTFCKIVANELNLPLERVIIHNPDTDRVPDSGPTVASRSLMVVGELLRRAAITLRSTWEEGKDQVVEERFKEPDFMIPFDLARFQGDAYPTYSWAVAAVELQVDTLTGYTDITGAWGVFDVGTPVDENIVIGQMEGGFLQGLGYSGMEQMAIDSNGRIRNNSYSDYIIPTAVDVPNLHCQLHVVEYPGGPYGAKGAGELPLVGVPAAYMEAMEQALGGAALHHIPFTTENVINTLQERS